jgi:glycosyltransferase involved in cell wall biosynthesis
VGTGELRAALERRIAELRLLNVRLEGAVDPSALVRYYQRATAVLLPSSHEGLPLVLLEAMAAGAPVVCSALPELMETGGVAVTPVAPLTAANLATTVQVLLADNGRRQWLSRASRERAMTYSWTAVAAAIDDLYVRVRREQTCPG